MALEWGAIFSAIGGLFKPITKCIDEVHVSAEERIKAKAALTEVQADVAKKWMDLEGKVLDSQQAIIAAESGSDSWLTKAWRPIVMLTFLWIIVSYVYGWVPENLNPEIMEWIIKCLSAGLGGYTVGRSAEKIIKIVNTMKKPEG